MKNYSRTRQDTERSCSATVPPSVRADEGRDWHDAAISVKTRKLSRQSADKFSAQRRDCMSWRLVELLTEYDKRSAIKILRS